MSVALQPSTFERLEKRFRITATVETLTGLRVGAGKRFDAAATDQPVMRDGSGRPFIPGSSLKGALRAGLERVLRGLGSQALDACDLFEEPCTHELQEAAKKGQPPTADEVCAALCSMCGLFGSPLFAGRTFIHDLYLEEGATSIPELRDGVGIDRDLGVARPAVKYDFEAIPPGSRFDLEMLLENVADHQLALMIQGLTLLDDGQILLGGLTSRGLGRVRLDAIALEWTDAARLIAGEGFAKIDYRAARESATQTLRNMLQTADKES